MPAKKARFECFLGFSLVSGNRCDAETYTNTPATNPSANPSEDSLTLLMNGYATKAPIGVVNPATKKAYSIAFLLLIPLFIRNVNVITPSENSCTTSPIPVKIPTIVLMLKVTV